jgi:hypothetical protein
VALAGGAGGTAAIGGAAKGVAGLSRTQILPSPGPHGAAPGGAGIGSSTTAARHFRWRGPAGLTVAAVGVAAVALLVLLGGHLFGAGGPPTAASPGQVSANGNQSTAVPATTAPAAAPVAPADQLDVVRTAVWAQVRAGQLRAGDAADLTKRLDEIGRRMSRGQTDKVAEKINDLRNDLAGLRQDGKLGASGYAAVLSSLDPLAANPPPARD